MLCLQGESEKGIQRYEDAMKIARKYKQHELESNACLDLGLLFFYKGEAERTRTYEKKARRLRHASTSEVCKTNHLLLSSLMARSNGDYEKAVSLLKRGLKIHRAGENKSQTLVFLNACGEVQLQKEEWREALGTFDEQIEIAKSTGEIYQKGLGLVNSAECLIKIDEHTEAESRLHEGLHYFKMINDIRMMAKAEQLFDMLPSRIGSNE